VSATSKRVETEAMASANVERFVCDMKNFKLNVRFGGPGR